MFITIIAVLWFLFLLGWHGAVARRELQARGEAERAEASRMAWEIARDAAIAAETALRAHLETVKLCRELEHGLITEIVGREER